MDIAFFDIIVQKTCVYILFYNESDNELTHFNNLKCNFLYFQVKITPVIVLT